MAAGDPDKQKVAKSCPSCGQLFDVSISFCPHDGTRLNESSVNFSSHESIKITNASTLAPQVPGGNADKKPRPRISQRSADDKSASSSGKGLAADGSETLPDSKSTPDAGSQSDPGSRSSPDKTTPTLSGRDQRITARQDHDTKESNLVGTTLDEQYEVIEVIGHGGMSIVYKARHLILKRTVAIKTLLPHLMLHPLSLHRFQVEAQAASNLRHPNVITVYDFGTTPDGQPYLVMDYLEGESLGEVVEREHHISPERALPIFIQVADALGHAHDKGIIHRDLKPTNVLLLNHGGVKDFVNIVDFGIAKLLPHEGNDVVSLTQTGEVFGSPMYMSPEQCKGQKLDSRADIYSMGCLMYETLCGRTPVESDNTMEVLFKHINEVPKPMSDRNVHVPEALERIVFKALAKDPAQRYQTMGQLKDELQKFVDLEKTSVLGRLTSRWELFWLKRRPRTVREKITVSMAILGVSAALILSAQLIWLYWNAANSPATKTRLVWDEDKNIPVSQPTDNVTATINTVVHYKSAVAMKERGDPPGDIMAFLGDGINEVKEQGAYREAARLAGLAAQYAIEFNGPQTMPAIQWQREYANCLVKAHEYKTAADALRRLIDMLSILGRIEKAQVEGDLGDCYYFQGQWQNAAQAYVNFMRYVESSGVEGSDLFKEAPEIALVRSRLATCYDRLAEKATADGWTDQARSFKHSAAAKYKESYEKWRLIRGDVNDNESVALVNGLVDQHFMDKSANLDVEYDKALHDIAALFGKDSPYNGVTLMNYSDYLFDRGNVLASAAARIQAWNIFSKIR